MNDQPDCVAEIYRAFGQRWQIALTDLNVWEAVRRSADGRHVRVLIAHHARDLRAKLESADAETP